MFLGKKLSKIMNKCGFEIFRYDPLGKYRELIEFVRPYTMTSNSSLISLIDATEYVINNKIPGSFVECGVWKGGSMMAVAKTLSDMNVNDRDLYLFDTFTGMTKPSNIDIGVGTEEKALEIFDKEKTGNDASNWLKVTIDEVKKTFEKIEYNKKKIYFIQGKVEDTIPKNIPSEISLLRLDTDWYESTKHELDHLFPKLSRGGIIIIDDYDDWAGSRKAVDEYIINKKISLLLIKIPNGGRIGIKI
jgi:O-methyltransferase